MNQAGWLRAQVAEKGLDLESTRAVALGLDAATWDAAGVAQRGAAGGEAPRPYPDKGHLLGSGVQDAANRGAYAYDECPSAFGSHEDDENGVQDGTSSPVADPRRAVESRRRATAGDPKAPAGERGRTWERRRTDRELEFELRVAVEAVTGRPIVDGKGQVLECNEDGMVYGHVRVVDAFRFRVHTCKARGRCPHCARAYALQQAAELRSLMAAALERRTQPLKAHDPLGWAFVVTMPPAITRAMGAMADDPRRLKELREHVTRLVRVARDHIAGMFHVEPRDLGAAVNVHWWSSETPTKGYHWHAHVMVPNVQRDGRELRRKALFSEKGLENGRRRLQRLIAAVWPEHFAAPDDVPVNYKLRYYLANEDGAIRWRHRARYDARHPFADALKQAGDVTDGGRELMYGDLEGAALHQLALRIEDLQSVKLRRYVGWLVPGRRKVVGLAKDEGEGTENEWYALPDGYRRIRGWTENGLELARFDLDTGEVTTEVMAELVDFDSQGPPVRWSYVEARDASRKVVDDV
jgi:hypothetical protein